MEEGVREMQKQNDKKLNAASEDGEQGNPVDAAGRKHAAPNPPVPFSVFGPASALYALFYTFCLYQNASGITYPFFVAGTLCFLYFCMKKYRAACGSRGNGEEGFTQGKREGRIAVFYAVSLLLLGVSVCLTDDGKILWMTKTGIFLLTVTLALHCFYKTSGWSFTKYPGAICRSLLETLHYLDTPFSDAGSLSLEGGKGQRRKNVGYFLLGLLIAIPLLFIILALLLSADAVFSDMVKRLLGDLQLSDVVLACMLTALIYVISYSFMRGLVTYRMTPDIKKEKRGEPLAAITFTSLTALIYFIFCTIQAVYLFPGRVRLPEGLTWAVYARQGFFQLLFVCLINLAMVLLCLALFKESRILKGILTAISLMTYILIASSAYRMILYVRNYYLTFLRLFVLWSLAVIGIIFAGVILYIYRERFPLFAYCTVVVTVFYIGLAFAKPDYWIAKYDLAHTRTVQSAIDTEEESGGRIFEDYRYLASLSADAAPILAEENYGKTGYMNIYYERIWENTQKMKPRSFNFSRWQAGKSLEKINYSLTEG